MAEPKVATPEPEQESVKAEEEFELGVDPILSDSEEKPIENYEKEEKKPYVVDYFEFDIPYYNVEEGPDRESLEVIDVFVKEEIEINNKKPNLRSYRKVLDNLKKRLGIDEDTEKGNVFERVAGFVLAYNKIREIEEKGTRNQRLGRLIKMAKDKNFDRTELKLVLQEEYIQWLSTNP